MTYLPIYLCDKSDSSDGSDSSDSSDSSDGSDRSDSSDSSDNFFTSSFFLNATKLEKLNFDNSQKRKLWQNSETQIVTKLQNLNCDKT